MNPRLKDLRHLMKRHRIDAYLVPSSDPHQSEYVPECWRRRQYLTGFTGSAGDALVTLDTAGLWTDSRYHLQAEKELRGSGFRLFKWGSTGVPSWQEWAARNLNRGELLGLDPQLIAHREYSKLEKDLLNRGVKTKTIGTNLVDGIWAGRPALPAEPITTLAERYAGESVRRKLGRLRRKMKAEDADAHVISQLDAIAWLFNIRGSDVPYNPVVIAHAVVSGKCDFGIMMNSRRNSGAWAQGSSGSGWTSRAPANGLLKIWRVRG